MSNSGPLIHLAKVGLLHLLKNYNVVIPHEVKYEVVDVGKERGYADAFLVERAIEDGWIRVINVSVDKKFADIAKLAGLHEAETTVVYYAYQNKVTALLDDDPARVFARALGVKVRGSLGLLIEGLKNGLITYSEALKGLDNFADIMYLSSTIYKLVLKEIEKWKH
ncbi:hypothetical protein TBCH5v1_0021 [Thermococcus barophilus]|uniref:Nucleic acid-binding protein n=1 Tax=Thermococcus barophilus TaxID=55802 RepID=A0A0S1X895_THEBA|nr:hypothetical protein TBCH5v1_0021 [Thermococcus barophilus]